MPYVLRDKSSVDRYDNLSLNTINCFLFWKLFDTQIEPLITYGAEIWGLDVNLHMEKVHTYAIKRF